MCSKTIQCISLNNSDCTKKQLFDYLELCTFSLVSEKRSNKVQYTKVKFNWYSLKTNIYKSLKVV